jgi:hypothetical protein
MLKKLLSIVMIGCMLAIGSFTVAPVMTQAKQLTDAEKQEKKDKKYLGFTTKKLDGIQTYLDRDNLVSARRDLESALRYYEKLSDDFKQSDEGVALTSEIDALGKKLVEAEAASQAESDNKSAILDAKVSYGTAIRPYLSSFHMMWSGQNNDRGTYGLDNVATLIESYSEMDAFEAQFKEKFAVLIEQEPTYTYEGFSVADVLAFLKDKKTYRDTFVTMVCGAMLDEFAASMEEVYTQLEEQGYFNATWMDDLYGDLANEEFESIKRITPYYGQIGQTAPQEKLDAIAAYKPKMRALLEKTAKKGSFDKSTYSYCSSEHKKVAENYGKEYNRNMSLVKVAQTSKDEWDINKNSLGIPLGRTGHGFVVYEVDGEPFKRGYKASFYSEYNGNGYEPISSIDLGYYIYPIK